MTTKLRRSHLTKDGAKSIVKAIGGRWKSRKRICIVKGCLEPYQGKTKEALHRCSYHRAELKGFKKMVSDPLLLKYMTKAQRENKSLAKLAGKA